MNNLIDRLVTAGIAKNGFVKLNDFQIVDVDTFNNFFGSTDGTYNALIAADTNPDGNTKGYAQFFNAWKDAGIL